MGSSEDSESGGEVLSQAQRLAARIANQEVSAWGGGVSGDFFNAVSHLTFNCRMPESWPGIQPIRTIEGYVQDMIAKAGGPDASEVAAQVIGRINSEFLVKANNLIAEMNFIIGAGITSEEQANTLLAKCDAFSRLLYNREG